MVMEAEIPIVRLHREDLIAVANLTAEILHRMMQENKKYYTSKELAEVANKSVKWVEKWRPHIAGARREGRDWRFDKSIVDTRIATGKGLIIK